VLWNNGALLEISNSNEIPNSNIQRPKQVLNFEYDDALDSAKISSSLENYATIH
jgi:hypothetical protein